MTKATTVATDTLRDRFAKQFIADDPGLQRLLTASRATLAVGLASIIFFQLAESAHQAITMAFIGIIVVMMGSIAVADEKLRDQKTTTLLLAIPATLALLAGAILAQWHVVSLLMFVGLTFLSIESRRYGARGTALGIMAFMTYFCSLFFQASVEALPWMIVAICAGVVISYASRFWILPNRASKQLAWTIKALRFRIADLLNYLAQSLTMLSARPAPPQQRDQILQRMSKINEVALELEDLLLKLDLANEGHHIFELELSAAQIMETSRRLARIPELPTAVGHGLAQILVSMASQIKQSKRNFAISEDATRAFESMVLKSDQPSLELSFKGVTQAIRCFARNAEALRKFEEEIEERFKIAKAPIKAETPEKSQEKSGDKLPELGLHIYTKQAIQATLAVGAAATIGSFVNPPTWSWAAIAAYVIFTGTTRGENLRRGAQRVVGTASGILAGIALATVFSLKNVELGLIFICIFFGIYLIKKDYAWSTMWFTTMVAMLYKILGRYSGAILTLRLEQTVVGVSCAVLASLFVMPNSTRASIGKAFVLFLRALASALKERPLSEKARQRPASMEFSRVIDRKLQALRLAAAPMLGSAFGLRSTLVDGLLHDASALGHYARIILLHPEESASSLDQRKGIATKTEALAIELEDRIKSDGRPEILRTQTTPLSAESSNTLTSKAEERWLDRMDQLLEVIKKRLHLEKDFPSA